MLDKKVDAQDSGSKVNGLTNVIGLLRLLSRQLELSMEESFCDVQRIIDFCLNAPESIGEGENEITKHEVISALQYYDRQCQRIANVEECIKRLADNIGHESWLEINIDLAKEIEKTNSFYTQCQVKEMNDLAKGIHCNNPKDSGSESGVKNENPYGDMELF